MRGFEQFGRETRAVGRSAVKSAGEYRSLSENQGAPEHNL
jgi:hypothetical protein